MVYQMKTQINRRRNLLAALGAGAVTAPFAARAQAPGAAAGKVWRVGFLSSIARPADLGAHYYGGFLDGMRELGYVEGRNLVIEWRFADGDIKRLPILANTSAAPHVRATGEPAAACHHG